MIPQQPIQKPRPNFGSGPCPKRPGFDHSVAYRDTAFGRSHRSKLGLGKIQDSLKLSRELLGLPDDYLIGIVPASDTGAVEMAMWNLLGPLNVSVIFFDSFGKEWWTDASSQLKLPKLVKIDADFGETPDATKVDWEGDVVFTWNGTTAGVKMPNGDWIPDDRKGITICDATSAIFAMDLPWNKLDVVTYSWQKVLGGEAAHGMMILSPRAIARLNSYMPPWPLPKIFRLRKGDKLNTTIFDGSVINTVSMLCVEDYLDALMWTKSLGGLKALVERSEANLAVFTKFVEEHDWIEFLCKKKEWRSNTSVCFVINDLDGAEVKKMTALLAELKVAFDINSYRDAPAGLRIWCGATVDAADCEKLCPWLEWAHTIVKNKISWKQKIIVTDGMAAPAVKELESLGFDVTLKKFSVEELQEGALADYDAVVIRSATKLMEKEIEAACKKEGNRLRIIARAGVGVDNVHVPTATKLGIVVINAPLAATRSVAELALAHMLCSVRQLTFADRGARAGQWLKASIKGTELHGKRLGFVGFGRIGQEFGRMAQGLGMELHAYDPFLPPEIAEKAGCVLHADIHELFATCTHITIHCNLTPDTKNLVGRELVLSMPSVSPDGTKCGRHIVNCARGGVIDEDACADLLKEGHLSSLALDVFATEPMPKDIKLLECDHFHCTPHVGASTLEAQSRVGAQTVEALIASLQGNVPRANFVNPDVVPRK